MSIKEEEYVIPKDAIFGKLFGSQSVEKEPVLEISYYYMKWREFAKRLLIPIIDNLIEKYAESLQNYYDRLADAYLENLREAIKEQETSKEKISCQLSEEDKRLEEDLDWCNKVIEQLRIIERG